MKCYVGVAEKGILAGDNNAKWILHCLACCTEVYGETIVVHQYVPFVMSKVVNAVYFRRIFCLIAVDKFSDLYHIRIPTMSQ